MSLLKTHFRLSPTIEQPGHLSLGAEFYRNRLVESLRLRSGNDVPGLSCEQKRLESAAMHLIRRRGKQQEELIKERCVVGQ